MVSRGVSGPNLGTLRQSSHLWQAHGGNMLEYVASGSWFSVPSPDSHLSQVLRMNLLSSMKTTGCQWGNSLFCCSLANAKHQGKVLGCKHSLHPSGPHTPLLESISDHVSRHVHICGLLEVFAGLLQCSSCSLQKGGVRVVALLWPPPHLSPVSW